MRHKTNQVISYILLKLIPLYRALRMCVYPYHTCRFIPSCSEYTRIAIEKFGPLKGTFYGIRRLLQCNFVSRTNYNDKFF
jgi:putative component of membrane protein insertase Oxa1/YidC/SpoIIIJ protein YidD